MIAFVAAAPPIGAIIYRRDGVWPGLRSATVVYKNTRCDASYWESKRRSDAGFALIPRYPLQTVEEAALEDISMQVFVCGSWKRQLKRWPEGGDRKGT